MISELTSGAVSQHLEDRGQMSAAEDKASVFSLGLARLRQSRR